MDQQTLLEFLVLALVQGTAEVFPVSSSGHLAVVNALLVTATFTTMLLKWLQGQLLERRTLVFFGRYVFALGALGTLWIIPLLG